MPIQCDYHMHTPLCKHATGPMEDYVQRVEQNPPSIPLSPRWRDTAFLRREAARWRAYAQVLTKQPD